ncbi:GPP34 family phosphoprotein, partial [Streptomyces sp. NPDC060209]|uniref:GOLPH3/VPS74 family protein n=1 Tax=Streptomyces sp. NPDC060209 TaxID=3347073 RepID=UPI00364731F3
MTTAKDLFIIALHLGPPNRPVGQGDLSLALAGAELIDLVAAHAATLEGDRIVPDRQPTLDDHLLGEAAAALDRQAPYERVEDWLWRRGRELSATYQAALEEDGQLDQGRHGRLPLGADRVEPADTPSRRQALNRWEENEPVLAALASAVGIRSGRPEDEPGVEDEAVTTVLAAVSDAVIELEAVRQRRSIENAAFANVWR